MYASTGQWTLYTNKALVSEVKKIAEISVVDGVSNFAPKIIAERTNC